MHKVLKDYLMTSQGDLLYIINCIKQMVNSQYSKYQKDIASARYSIKFRYKPEKMLFLPPRIYNIIIPIAIKLV
jgi:hypothetical protein